MVCIESTAGCCFHGYEARSRMCADDLVLMEPIGRRLAEYKFILLDKEYNVNAGKSNGW